MTTKELILSAMFVALISISSMIILPIGPIPFTLQTPLVILVGALLGSRRGSLIVCVYLLVGLVGIPVFAGGNGGISALVSPSFGFVLGFIPLAFFSGLGDITENNIVKVFLYTFIGLILLFSIGLLYFCFVMNVLIGTSVSIIHALALTVTPFILKDIILTILSVLFAKVLVRRGITVSN